jgi:disulfide oxidoreductase YuzD
MDLERVRKTVRRKFGLDEFKVKYVDEDEDLITVCDSGDLELAMSNGGIIIM